MPTIKTVGFIYILFVLSQRGRSQQRRPAPVVGGESSAVTNPCTNPSPSAMASGPRVKSVPEGGSDVGALSPPPALQRADKEGSHAVSREQNKDKGAVPPIHQLMTDPPNKVFFVSFLCHFY